MRTFSLASLQIALDRALAEEQLTICEEDGSNFSPDVYVLALQRLVLRLYDKGDLT
jgi:hypothetical protein